eukprot:scpid100529/ scgid2425/ 
MSPEHNPRRARMTPKCENEKQFERSRGSKKCPGAGQHSGTAVRVLARVDGAHPHTAKINARVLAAQGKAKGFDIWVAIQPTQSSNLNFDDLVFFHSLQADLSLVTKETRKKLLQAVETCWHEYPVAKMRSIWLCLYASFHHGILESGRDNNYQRHCGGRQAHSQRHRAGASVLPGFHLLGAGGAGGW